VAIAVLVEQWVAGESAIHLAETSGPVNLPAIVFTLVYVSVRLGPWEGACGLSVLWSCSTFRWIVGAARLIRISCKNLLISIHSMAVRVDYGRGETSCEVRRAKCRFLL
jgi:hypothetical protein